MTEDEVAGQHHRLQQTVKDREAWHAVVHRLQRVGHDLATEHQSIRGHNITLQSSVQQSLLMHMHARTQT